MFRFAKAEQVLETLAFSVEMLTKPRASRIVCYPILMKILTGERRLWAVN